MADKKKPWSSSVSLNDVGEEKISLHQQRSSDVPHFCNAAAVGHFHPPQVHCGFR